MTTTLSDSDTVSSDDELEATQSQAKPEHPFIPSNPLHHSLIAFSFHPNCPSTPGFFDKVAVDDQPCHVSSASDSADYFVDNKGHPISIVFPAELYLEGKYNCTGVYFNQPQQSVSYMISSTK